MSLSLMFLVLGLAFFVPQAAAAQAATAQTLSGLATISIARGSGDDVTENKWTPGASIAIVGRGGLGSELDVWQLRDFASSRYAESRVTALMLNATGIWPDPRALVRPFVLGGVGLMRSRVCAITCDQAVSTTQMGLDAGGGAFFLWNEIFGARAEVRYFQYLQKQDVLPLAADGGYFSFWRFSIGATYAWPLR
jgi:hypothetical protein